MTIIINLIILLNSCHTTKFMKQLQFKLYSLYYNKK